jgi:hypothetical protein
MWPVTMTIILVCVFGGFILFLKTAMNAETKKGH